MAEIHQELLRQLGGLGRLKAMINAKNFVCLNDGLQFQFMKGAKGINAAVIRLNANDLYDVQFLKFRGFDAPKVVEEIPGAYADMLADLFRNVAGLAIRL